MAQTYPNADIHFTLDDTHIQAMNIVYGQCTSPIPAHSHGSGSYEIHYIPCGQGRLQAAGVFYELTPGTLYVTGPHIEHAQFPVMPDSMQEYCVYLKIRDTARQQKASPLIDAFTSTPFWIGTDTQLAPRILLQLFDELNHHYIGWMEQARLLLSQLVICMVRNYTQHPVSPAPFFKKNLADTDSIIIEEYFLYEYRSLSLQELAGRLRLSPRQTQRLLMEYYGKTFQQKKAEAKMSAAAILLTDRERSITSIAEDLGYSSAEHFSGSFRKYYGTSPREYRKRL